MGKVFSAKELVLSIGDKEPNSSVVGMESVKG